MFGLSRYGEDFIVGLHEEVVVDEAANFGTEAKEVWLRQKEVLAEVTVCWKQELRMCVLMLGSPSLSVVWPCRNDTVWVLYEFWQ